MSETDFQVSAVLITGLKKAAAQLGVADACRAQMDAAAGALWDRPGDRAWHPGHLFQSMTVSMTKVISNEQVADLYHRLCRDQFGPIVTGMIRIAVAISGSTPHTVFANMKPMLALAIKGASAEYVRSGERSGKFAATYPLAFPPATSHAWSGVARYCCEIVGHTAVIDRVETLNGGHRYEVDLHW